MGGGERGSEEVGERVERVDWVRGLKESDYSVGIFG